VFYPNFYAVTQHDVDNPLLEVTASSDLQKTIRQLINIRRQYLGGMLTVLTKSDKHLYVARRQGNAQNDGAIIMLNNHDTDTLSITLNVNPDGFRIGQAKRSSICLIATKLSILPLKV